MNGVLGIHHITGIAGSPQKNLDFYAGILGLRFLKRTINFDDPHTYHFYFGDADGSPGTILTFFPWSNNGLKGRRGTGQVTTISFSVPSASIEFWKNRLREYGISYIDNVKKFGSEVLMFEDFDGFELELIGDDEDVREGWSGGTVEAEHSVRGFHSVTLNEEGYGGTVKLMEEVLGFRKVSEEGSRIRFEAADGGPGKYADILITPQSLPGRMGVGAVHHIAWRADDDEHQLLLKDSLEKAGMNVTPVMDRNYFHSIYFREPGSILFEVATDPPGFFIDESKHEAGSHLKLPPWYEKHRNEIEAALPAINTDFKAAGGL